MLVIGTFIHLLFWVPSHFVLVKVQLNGYEYSDAYHYCNLVSRLASFQINCHAEVEYMY